MIGNYIKAVVTAVSRSTAKLMKTGQTTSYRTGDDGDLEAGRNTSFTVLAENNPFGNTNRFTDELGGQTYTKNIVIDWSTYDGATVLGFRRTKSQTVWNSAIDGALVVSIAPFTTNWRLPNIKELINIMDYALTSTSSYAPFYNGENLYSSTTYSGATTNALTVMTTGQINITLKASNVFWIPCRNFTVTGTTLS